MSINKVLDGYPLAARNGFLITNVLFSRARVDHKAFVEVNEKGTEAAAVTVVGVGVTSMPTFKTFNADRPFVFMIRDDRSGSILFMGKITNPLESTSP